MADEKIEMNEEELDGIAGGYVFDTQTEGNTRYEVIDLKGNVIGHFSDMTKAKKYAFENMRRASLNRRTTVINQRQLDAMRRKH
ncbi:MAG: hypothetical protein IKG18_05820 [Atopobiaceae bacterium]|nr:hypothetical protein [Atopobiaceae bacterium]